MYQRSARIYDLLYAEGRVRDIREDAAGLRDLIHKTNPTARTLLDVACGTGQHLAFLREDFEVEGVGQSPEMIAVARDRLVGVRLSVGDMRRLRLGRRYDAVICLLSSIGYVTDARELLQTLRRFAEHLEPEASSFSTVGFVRMRGMTATARCRMSPMTGWSPSYV